MKNESKAIIWDFGSEWNIREGQAKKKWSFDVYERVLFMYFCSNLNNIMFCSQLYDSSLLSSIYPRSDRKLHRHLPLPASERCVLISALHMLLGMPSAIFLKNGTRFSMTQQPIQMSHLAGDTLSSSLVQLAESGSQLQFIREEAKRIYGMHNSLLKAFAESVLGIIHKIQSNFTDLLKTLQQQGGKLQRSEAEYNSSANRPITLISLLQATKNYSPLLTFIVSTFSRMALRESASQSDLQTAVLFLLNLYHLECSREYLLPNQLGANLHLIFNKIMRSYLLVIQEWFEMDQSALAMKTHLGFFIELDQILQLQEEKIFDVRRITRREVVPEVLRTVYERVVELGKTIQFIRLYFGPEDRERYRIFMKIPQLFEPLYVYIDFLQGSEVPVPFFAAKDSKYQTISSKLSMMVRPSVKNRKINHENPYKMHPEMTGIINLRSDYKFIPKQGQKYKEILTSSSTNKQDESCLDTNRRIESLLNALLDSISKKCLQILQQQRIRSSIQRTLRGIKKIMLFQQGDFIQQFLELTKELFERPAEKISRNNIQRLIEEAVRSSGARDLPQAIRQNISFTFLRNSQGIKAWRIFSLAYMPEKPTHCIFPQKVMADYGLLNNMLWNLRHCEGVLSTAWSKGCAGMSSLIKARNAVHHYLKALQSYIFAQLQALWGELLGAIGQTGSVLTIIELNQRALARIRATTFESQPLCNCLLSLVKIVDRFENIQTNLDNGIEQGIRGDVDQIWSWFMAMLDQSRLIPHFSDSFDFRGQYSL